METLLLRVVSLFGLFAAINANRQWMAWVGSSGVFPWKENRRRLAVYGRAGYVFQPTVLWWCTESDRALARVPYLAMVASVLNVVYPTTPGSLLQWWLFLSMHCVIPWTFDFPWYNLLSESMFLLAWAPRVGDRDPVLRCLVQLLLFRVMFGFGKSKYMGVTDSLSQSARYIQHMMVNQPLATPLGWWAATHVPLACFAMANVGTFIVEVILPFTYWWRPLRATAGILTIGLMAGIQVAGNYGFFNMLTAALATILVLGQEPLGLAWRAEYPLLAVLGLLAVCKLPLNSWTHDKIWFMACIDDGARKLGPPGRALVALLRYTSFFKVVNGYGIFGPNTTPAVRPVIVFQSRAAGSSAWVDAEYHAQSSGPGWTGAWVAPFHWFLDHLMCYEGGGMQSNFLLNSLVPHYYPSHPTTLREIVQRVLERWPRPLFRGCPPLPAGSERRAVVYLYAPGVERTMVLVHTLDPVDRFPGPFDMLWFDRHVSDGGSTGGTDEHDAWLQRRRALWRRACDEARLSAAPGWSGLLSCYEERMDRVRSELGGWGPEFSYYLRYMRSCAAHMRAMEPYRGESMRFLTTRAPFRDLYVRTLELNEHVVSGTVPPWKGRPPVIQKTRRV